MWRTYSENAKTHRDKVQKRTDIMFSKPGILYIFAGLMIFSGLLCFLLQKNWFVGLHYVWKIPFYVLLGVSFAFVVMFILADCLNYCTLTCSGPNARTIIESPQQIYVLTATALLMGCAYGLIFGLLDVEDADLYRLAVVALKDEAYCYPIGLVLGFLAGFANEMMRESGGQLRFDFAPARYEDEI